MFKRLVPIQLSVIRDFHISNALLCSKKKGKARFIDDTDANSPIGKLERSPKREPGVAATTGTTSTQSDAFKPYEDGVNPVTGEIGGPVGPEPTRYGDWERKGRVSDF